MKRSTEQPVQPSRDQPPKSRTSLPDPQDPSISPSHHKGWVGWDKTDPIRTFEAIASTQDGVLSQAVSTSGFSKSSDDLFRVVQLDNKALGYL